MEPWLLPSDWIVVSRWTYCTRLPLPGDVVALDDGQVLRLLGVGGDVIHLLQDGKIIVDGPQSRVVYQATSRVTHGKNRKLFVPGGALFLVGCGPGETRDSRTLGCISPRRVEGQVVFLAWPPQRRRLISTFLRRIP